MSPPASTSTCPWVGGHGHCHHHHRHGGSPAPPGPHPHRGAAAGAERAVRRAPDSRARQALADMAGLPVPALARAKPPSPVPAAPARHRLAPAGQSDGRWVTSPPSHSPSPAPARPLTGGPCGRCRGSAGRRRAGWGWWGCGRTTGRSGCRRVPGTRPTPTTPTSRSQLGGGHWLSGGSPTTAAVVPPRYRNPPAHSGSGRQSRSCPSRHVQRRQSTLTGCPGRCRSPPAWHGHCRGRTHRPLPSAPASSTSPAAHQHPAGGWAGGWVRSRGEGSPLGCPPAHLGRRAGGAGSGGRRRGRRRTRGRGHRARAAAPQGRRRRWGTPLVRRGLGQGGGQPHGDHLATCTHPPPETTRPTGTHPPAPTTPQSPQPHSAPTRIHLSPRAHPPQRDSCPRSPPTPPGLTHPTGPHLPMEPTHSTSTHPPHGAHPLQRHPCRTKSTHPTESTHPTRTYLSLWNPPHGAHPRP